jgi:putative transposase
MHNTNEIRTGRHCVFNLHVHLVFVTKYRRQIFTKNILDEMEEVLKVVCADFDAELVEFDGERTTYICWSTIHPKYQSPNSLIA